MPIYEYACDCGEHADKLRKWEARDEPVSCDCGEAMRRVFSNVHCAPDGVYSYAPNLGDADRFERQRHAIKHGIKTMPRHPDLPREHRDGQLTSKRR